MGWMGFKRENGFDRVMGYLNEYEFFNLLSWQSKRRVSVPRWIYIRVRGNFVYFLNGRDKHGRIVKLGTNMDNLLK